MDWILLVIGTLVLLFGFVVFFGAPYLPTLSLQVETALKLADLKKGQHLLELGCGDGRVLIAAAKQGLQVTGYELNPLLAGLCWLRTRRYKKQVRVVWGNFWLRKLPAADAIFVFLLPKYMNKLDKKVIQQTSKPVKLVSFAFLIRGKEVVAEKDGVYLYAYN
jgi:16S rRNA A1518/A1519 N6-dimethyltransferase RsmA/KsgA/DIM1 with predicted DNA glycosylase/AP lyase activity